jgi:hypothetical protein
VKPSIGWSDEQLLGSVEGIRGLNAKTPLKASDCWIAIEDPQVVANNARPAVHADCLSDVDRAYWRGYGHTYCAV